MNDAMEKTEEIVKRCQALGADHAIASTVFGEYRQARFSNNQIDIEVAWNDYTTNLMVAWKKRVVATQIKNFQNISKATKRLMKLARISKENPTYGGIAHGSFRYAKPSADITIRNIDDSSEYVNEAIEAARREGGKNITAGGILFTKFQQIFLSSSEGPKGQDKRSAIELSIRAFSERDASGHGVECSSALKDFNPARAGEKAGWVAKLARKPRAGKTGNYDVIFDPLFFGSLAGVYGYMGSAYNVMIRMSVFADKLGARVASNIVTLRDNPGKNSVSHRIFDDEGARVNETVFIENGILKTYFHNTSTAKIFKTESTGHAGLIEPMPWSLEMDSGNSSKDEMFKDMKRGLYLTNTWYTRFQNYATGTFSTVPRDGIFLVENGEVTQSWKQIRISGNLLKIFMGIDDASKERQHVHWWLEAEPPSLSPYVRARNVQITKPE